jgi:hypothetical protein
MDAKLSQTRDEARKKYDWGQLYNIFVTLGSFFINRPKLAMISERFALGSADPNAREAAPSLTTTEPVFQGTKTDPNHCQSQPVRTQIE